jgi:hypothetical protein
MLEALAEAEAAWPGYQFRGHNVANQRPGLDRLRPVR